MRRSVRLAKVPVIDGTETMDNVFLPGTTTGTILAGAGPVHAVHLPFEVVFIRSTAMPLMTTIVSRPPRPPVHAMAVAQAARALNHVEGRGAPCTAPRPPPSRCPPLT